MRFCNTIIGLAALAQGINAVAVPDTHVALDAREPQPDFESTSEELWKRKGGGGGGGRGGGGSSSGGGKGGGSSSGGGKGSGSSNTGGSTTTGSGPGKYKGGNYYGGGAATPYTSGARSPGGILPFVLAGTALTAITFGGVALAAGAYAYPFNHPHYYHNATTHKNETKPVTCVCEPYQECGCDENGNQTYFDSVIGDGSYQNLNHSLVTVAKNDTTGNDTIYINGGLPNGTTAPGGTEDPNAAPSINALAQALGWWPLATTALAFAYLM